MKLNKTVLSVLVFSIISTTHAHALQPLAEFVKLGRKNATRAQLAKVGVEVKKAERDSQRGKLGPSIGVTFAYNYNPNPITQDLITPDPFDPNATVTNTIVVLPRHQMDVLFTARMPLIDFEAVHRYRAARAGVNAEEFKAQALIAKEVDTIVTQTYLNAYINGTQLVFAGERLSRVNELLAIARQKESNGSSKEFEVDDFTIESRKLEGDIKLLNNALDKSTADLYDITQMKADIKDLTTFAFDETVYEEGALEDWISASTTMPEIRSAKANVDVADANVSAARSRYLPKVAAVAGDRYTNATGLQDRNNTWSAGIVASIDFDFSKPADVSLARHNKKVAELNLTEARSNAVKAIREAFALVDEQKTKFEIQRDIVIVSRKKALAAVQKYNNGLASVQDMIMTEDKFYVDTQNKFKAYGDYLIARANLRILTGQDIARSMSVNAKKESNDDDQIPGAGSIEKLK